MGRRLGYDVSNGLYRGRKNEVGFDGLWKSQDGTYIIMESKTSDDYSISIESVIGYRDKLLILNSRVHFVTTFNPLAVMEWYPKESTHSFAA